MGKTIAAVFLPLLAVSVKEFPSWLLLSALPIDFLFCFGYNKSYDAKRMI